MEMIDIKIEKGKGKVTPFGALQLFGSDSMVHRMVLQN